MMLCVRPSLARKSSTSARSSAVFGPSDTTVEKPTAFVRAQSSIAVVSAPDCDTSASDPASASGPAALALSCRCGRCSPALLGPSRCRPSRRAIFFSSAAWAGVVPLETTSALRHDMRPATSSAAAACSGGSAITARSARACARSPSVPLVRVSTNCSVPLKRCPRSASDTARDHAVWLAGRAASPAKTTIDSGANSGVR